MITRTTPYLYDVSCDFCSSGFKHVETDNFRVVLKVLEDDGWLTRKNDEGEWVHKCTDCTDEGLNPMSTSSQAIAARRRARYDPRYSGNAKKDHVKRGEKFRVRLKEKVEREQAAADKRAEIKGKVEKKSKAGKKKK